jgi:acyl dehydratase
MTDGSVPSRLWRKGRTADAFEVGQEFEHHWGRTVTDGDNALFTTLTQSYNPIYLNRDYAVRAGHRNIVVNPYLVFSIVFGMSVEDLSESRQGGGAFLGIDDLRFLAAVYPGDTLYARSRVMEVRQSQSQPNKLIITWHTEGRNQDGTSVIEFRRTNMRLKEASADV